MQLRLYVHTPISNAATEVKTCCNELLLSRSPSTKRGKLPAVVRSRFSPGLPRAEAKTLVRRRCGSGQLLRGRPPRRGQRVPADVAFEAPTTVAPSSSLALAGPGGDPGAGKAAPGPGGAQRPGSTPAGASGAFLALTNRWHF